MLSQAPIATLSTCLAQGSVGWIQFLPMIVIMALAYVMFILPQQQKDRRYREMVAGIKEKDHIVTSGGIYGVVTSVQRNEERVTIRIDEATGAKMRIGIWAISQVINDDAGDDKAK